MEVVVTWLQQHQHHFQHNHQKQEQEEHVALYWSRDFQGCFSFTISHVFYTLLFIQVFFFFFCSFW